jgi:hypothetical protein
VSEIKTTDDGQPPFHLVNRMNTHIGPFSQYTDALLARSIGEGIWAAAEIMDNVAFGKHLDGLS